MTTGSEFSADNSILGFKYQIRYALFLLFEAQRTHGFDVSVDIERIDDIDVHAGGTLTKLVQTKDTATVLTNSSAPLWKTVRIWSEAAALTSSVNFDQIQHCHLITTSSASPDDDAIVSLIQKGDDASRKSALDQMRELASSKRDLQTLGAAYRAFDDLPASQQEKLVSKISITTNAMTFDQLDDRIVQHIVQGPPGKRLPFSKVLFGQWDFLVEQYLRQGKRTAISWDQLQSVLSDIAQQFRDDNLPTEFVDMIRDVLPSIDDDSRTFVRQLNAIEAGNNHIRIAQRVFLKATQLVSFWVRMVLIRPDELTKHASRLTEECELQHTLIKSNPLFVAASPSQIGMHIYTWAVNDAPHRESFRIRPLCGDLDVIRGCFHDLANQPKIGWHPDWQMLFSVHSGEST